VKKKKLQERSISTFRYKLVFFQKEKKLQEPMPLFDPTKLPLLGMFHTTPSFEGQAIKQYFSYYSVASVLVLVIIL